MNRKHNRKPVELKINDGISTRVAKGVEIGRTKITAGRQVQYLYALRPYLNAKEGDELVFIVVGGEVIVRNAATLKETGK